MSATEELSKLLEERGLSCQTHYLHTSWCVGQKLYEAVDNLDGTLTVDNLTPEQAVAATVITEWTCDECGGLTFYDAETRPRFCTDCGRRVVE